MIVHRIDRKEGNFTQMANSVIQDKQLSLKARGLMAFLLALAPGWKLNIKGLVTQVGHDGRDSVHSAFHELERNGYVKRRKPRDLKGQLLPPEYEVYEGPKANKSPQTGFPDTDNPAPDNPCLCNTKASNTESYKNMEIESGSILPEKKKEVVTVPATGSESDVVVGFTMKDYAIKVDLAMEQNLDLARNRYWRTLDASVTGGRSFSDAFGQKPCVAWTSKEYGFLREIAQFCVDQRPSLDPLAATESIVRAAFRRKGKAHQFLKYWVNHCRGKVSLKPYLTLGGGAQDPTKRLDILVELAANVDVEAGKNPAVQVNESQTKEGV